MNKNENVCRVCLVPNESSKFISLFETYKESTISSHIRAVTNVEIKTGDGYPEIICPECLLELETAVNFKQKCEYSDNILKSAEASACDNSVKVEWDLEEIKKEDADFASEFVDCFDDDSDHEKDNNDVEKDLNVLKDILTKTKSKKSHKKHKKSRERIEESHSINSKTKVQCADCGKSFQSKCKLRVHWKKMHHPQFLTCPHCKRQFKTYKSYHNHIKVRTRACLNASKCNIEGEGPMRIFRCKECEYKTKHVKDIGIHMMTHTGERPHKCEICNKFYTQLATLQAHMEYSHKQIKKETTCQYCGKFLRGRNQAYIHIKSHTDNKHQCDICHKVLRSRKILRLHKVRHTGIKNFTCDQCAATFYTNMELLNHRKKVHTKQEFTCDICGYILRRKDMLIRHKSRHSDTNIPCTVCGRFFNTEKEFATHQKVHLLEKKYPCHYCEKKFSNSKGRNIHMKNKHKIKQMLPMPQNVIVKHEPPPIQYDEVIEAQHFTPDSATT